MIMYSGFCVLKLILSMRRRGFYVIELIKKRNYWPIGINRYFINGYFRSKHTGDVGCISGKWDETEFNIFILRILITIL